METGTSTKKYEFKAEVKKLLDILVHSLYTSKDIFIRELISNASDALDKLRFESTRGTDIADNDLPLEIKIEFDDEKKILIIKDTGIGMTRDELITNIGTIAKSGTEEFLKHLAETKADATNIIGKFGVGFYSVFMAAKEVIIKTKSFRKDEPAVIWKSDGLGEYELHELDENIKRGTIIEIFLKDDAGEFAQKWQLETIIKKHSNFISFPIYVGSDKINTINALWREPKNSITKEQYNDFYKFLTYDNEEPLDVIHRSIDAPIQFNTLLFIPKKQNEFFWYDRENFGLDLYVRRVLIQHKNKGLLPEYLSFVKGVVDSEDLPLNISRETLQENIIFTKMASSITATVLNYLTDKAKNNPEEYSQFWKEHCKIFKLGYSDYGNHEKFLELLRFNSSISNNTDELVSFADYAARLKEGQKEIYYISGNSREALEYDPRMEVFKNKGVEVFYLYDPVDEFVFSSLRKYKEYDFVSVENADFNRLNEFKDIEERKKPIEDLSKDDEKHFSSLLSKMKSILGDKVVEVRESKRLIDSATCLVSENDTLSATMHKLMKLANKDTASLKMIFEINSGHLLIRNLLKVFKADENDEYIKNITEQLYEISLLQDGNLEDPHILIRKMNKLLEDSSGWYVEVKKY